MNRWLTGLLLIGIAGLTSALPGYETSEPDGNDRAADAESVSVVKKSTATGKVKRPAVVPRGLVINEDNSRFCLNRSEGKMTRAGLHEFIDQYAGTQVTHLFLCPNGMRVNYRTGAEGWESIWKGNHPEKSKSRWMRNFWVLDQRGLDPYAVWIARCREKGISPWITMRMNVFSFRNETGHFSHSTFWKKHPELWRLRPSRSELDYGIPAVRQRSLALISEFFERYDLDGLDLDWMRWPAHFRPGEEQKGRKVLTEFMGQVRKLADEWSAKRGHPIHIAARVPAVPEAALGLGLDGVAWAKAGLVDILVPAPFLDADFDIPVDRWRKLIGPTRQVALAPCLESDCRGNKELGPNAQRWVHISVEMTRGFVAAMLHRGADWIYLFNFLEGNWPNEEYRSILNECGRLETVVNKPRRHIVTSHDIGLPGKPNPTSLPRTLAADKAAKFQLYTGPRPTTGRVFIRAVLAKSKGVAQARVAARLNSVACRPMADLGKFEPFAESVRVMQFDVPIAAMREGGNQIEMTLETAASQRLIWLEMYLVPKPR